MKNAPAAPSAEISFEIFQKNGRPQLSREREGSEKLENEREGGEGEKERGRV